MLLLFYFFTVISRIVVFCELCKLLFSNYFSFAGKLKTALKTTFVGAALLSPHYKAATALC